MYELVTLHLAQLCNDILLFANSYNVFELIV